jgi:hypothetical protein
MTTSAAPIKVRTAYILTGESDRYGSGPLTALALTSIEEGESDLTDEELKALAESRIEEKVAELVAKKPNTNIIKRNVKVDVVLRKNPLAA